jgi:hypothetical protein
MIPRTPFREDGWDGYDHAAADGMAGPATNGYDYRYRDDQTGWVGGNPYYDPSVNLALEYRLSVTMLTFIFFCAV